MHDLLELLTDERDAILDNAAVALERSNLRHYAQDGAETSRQRLADLLALVVASISARDLVPMVDHATKVATERFAGGFDISEVQCAFNVLEEAIWSRVVEATAPRELAQSIGMVGTVVGAGRDALARTYVSLASHQHVPTLDLTALFRGGT